MRKFNSAVVLLLIGRQMSNHFQAASGLAASECVSFFELLQNINKGSRLLLNQNPCSER